MGLDSTLKIGITCYPSVGGSGILACALGEELAARGHEIHFISYGKPFRLPDHSPRVFFHPVVINDYGLFKYPDYTLPLSVKMAEVTRDVGLNILHVHYAVPHATAAILARSMLPAPLQPKVVATLHGTDTTLLGRDKGYGPAITHALSCSDAITTVSEDLKRETQRLLQVEKPIDVIHNFFKPRKPLRSPDQVKHELGLTDEVVLIHSSNLRPVKRIDLLLQTVSRVRTSRKFVLLILAGDDFSPFNEELWRLGLSDRVIVRERVTDVEDYLQIADIGLYTSDTESFCLSILEGMCFGSPSVATCVGGIPEVMQDGVSGLLSPQGDADDLAANVVRLIENPAERKVMGEEARSRAKNLFSADVIVKCYEDLYRRVLRSSL